MELYFGVFRVLSLVVVWAIPAILVVGVVAFLVSAPVLTLGGALLRLYDIAHIRLRRKPQAGMPILSPKWACSVDTDCPTGFVCIDGRCVPQKT